MGRKGLKGLLKFNINIREAEQIAQDRQKGRIMTAVCAPSKHGKDKKIVVPNCLKYQMCEDTTILAQE